MRAISLRCHKSKPCNKSISLRRSSGWKRSVERVQEVAARDSSHICGPQFAIVPFATFTSSNFELTFIIEVKQKSGCPTTRRYCLTNARSTCHYGIWIYRRLASGRKPLSRSGHAAIDRPSKDVWPWRTPCDSGVAARSIRLEENYS
jgi:hypothetical protein